MAAAALWGLRAGRYMSTSTAPAPRGLGGLAGRGHPRLVHRRPVAPRLGRQPLTYTLAWSGDAHSTWDAFNTQIRPDVGFSGINGGPWESADTTTVSAHTRQHCASSARLALCSLSLLLLPCCCRCRHVAVGGVERAARAMVPMWSLPAHLPDPRLPRATKDYEICGDGGGPNELWTYQHPEFINAVISLRQSLRLYVELHMTQASMDGVPIVWQMWYQSPADGERYSVRSDTQFMFDPDWLVAPVLAAHSNRRSVHLPWLPGHQAWLHHYGQQYHDGGQRLDITVTLPDFPLFQRVVTNPPAKTE